MKYPVRELSVFIYEVYQRYLKSESTNGVPFGDYLTKALLRTYKITLKDTSDDLTNKRG